MDIIETLRAAFDAGFPINPNPTREDLCDWLQEVDPNGCHTDALANVEGFEGYADIDETWQAVEDMLGTPGMVTL